MKVLHALMITLGFLFAWQITVWLLQLPTYILPAPLAVFKSLIDHALLIANNAWPTILETLLGLILGTFSGMAAALAISYFRLARAWFLPVLIISQALPIFAIAPLLVIWFGYGIASKVVVAMLMLFFPVASAFYDGLRRTPIEWLYLGKVMGASRRSLLLRIRLPASLPALGSGLRLAATFAPMGAVIGEWVGASKGLGFLLLNANARLQIDLMFAVLLVLVALTLILYFSVDKLLKKIIFWKV